MPPQGLELKGGGARYLIRGFSSLLFLFLFFFFPLLFCFKVFVIRAWIGPGLLINFIGPY